MPYVGRRVEHDGWVRGGAHTKPSAALGTQRWRIRSVGGALWIWDRQLRETLMVGEAGGRVRQKLGSLGSAGEGQWCSGTGQHDVGVETQLGEDRGTEQHLR